MNIAEKILRAKADLDSVYEAGVEKGRGEATDGVTVEPLEVTSNGTYTAPDGVGYSPVKVNVPDVNGSYDEGYEDGYEKGKAEGAPEDLNDVLTAQEEKLAELSAILDKKVDGYDSGFEDGKKAEHDAFWDVYQNNGKRTAYYYAFRYWDDTILRPKYDIKPVGDNDSIFREIKGITDFEQWQKDCGIVVDFSKVTSINDGFYGSSFESFGVLNFSKVSTMNFCFMSSKTKIIEKIKLPTDKKITFNKAFDNASNLEEIRFEGLIDNNGLDFQWSTKLSHDSLMSIINALKDYSGSGTAYTVTLGTTNLAKLTDAEKLIATQKGWTLA